MVTQRALVSISSVVVAVVMSSCASSPMVGTTQLTRAQMTGSGSPQLRTVDNAGFVYPGGQTAEVGQGVSPAVVGRGAYMTRPPMTERPPQGPATSARESPLPSGADRYQSIGRVAKAICDLETSCERIGPSGVFPSADACASEQRARLTDRIAKPGCEVEVRGDLLAACLRAIRAAKCNAVPDSSLLSAPCEQALPACN